MGGGFKLENHKQIEMVQFMRLLAALGIFVYHSGVVGQHGYFGVEIFNIISGYILVYSTRRADSGHGFLRKRLIRILPLYWGMTIMTYFLLKVAPGISAMSEAKVEYLFKSLLFVPFVNSYGYDVPLIGAGWTLNYEMFFFLLFWVALQLNHKYRIWIAGGMTLVFVAAGYMFRLPYVLDYYANLILLEFLMGFAAFYVVEWLRKYAQKVLFRILCPLTALVTYVWMMLDFGGEEQPLHRAIRIGIPALFFVVSMILLEEKVHIPGPVIALGNMTFSFYLIEFFTAAVYKVLFGAASAPVRWIALLVFAAATFVCSFVSYRVVEQGIGSRLRKKLVG